ncbi:hypothetical protein [Pseudorhizobium tarimense]
MDVELIGGRIYKHSNVSVGTVAIEAIFEPARICTSWT